MSTPPLQQPASSTATQTPQPPTTVPYVGSRISLISKSAIRYVGTLYTIDTKASTVALKDVRSFGTEGRVREGGPVEPSDRIYSYIVFRGPDILDLQFLTADSLPPKPSPPPQPTPQSPAPVQPTPPPPAPISPSPARAPKPRAWGPPPTPVAPHPKPASTIPDPPHSPPPPITTTPIPTLPSPTPHHQIAPPNPSFQHIPQQRPRPRPRIRPPNLPVPTPGGPWRRGPGITIPTEDFDFEQMHQKFDKASLASAFTPLPQIHPISSVAPPTVRYDKSKSFFDELVPEKELRGAQRSNAAQRRATDFETFGETVPTYHRNGFRHRGGRRGRGGRGRPRGRFGNTPVPRAEPGANGDGQEGR